MTHIWLKHAVHGVMSLSMFVYSLNYAPIPPNSYSVIQPKRIDQLDWAVAYDFSCIEQYNQYNCRKG